MTAAKQAAPSLDLRHEIRDFYDDYAGCLDAGDFDAWLDFFCDDCFYQIIPRNNWDQNLPLAALRCESKAMLRDRVVGVRETLMYMPRYVRHLVSAVRVLAIEDEVIRAEANYCVLQTLIDEETKVFLAGRYVDVIVRNGGRLRFKEKNCVFDSVVVPNSLIYPI